MPTPPIFVIANNIRSLYNVGSLFRLCDGVGVEKLYLTGITGAPFESVKYERQRAQIAKTALAGLEAVDWEYWENPIEVVKELKGRGMQIVALEQSESSIPFTQARFQLPVCLILGHETEGVDQRLLDISDVIVDIPMFGRGKSLNVISAASVMLYEIRLRVAGIGD